MNDNLFQQLSEEGGVANIELDYFKDKEWKNIIIEHIFSISAYDINEESMSRIILNVKDIYNDSISPLLDMMTVSALEDRIKYVTIRTVNAVQIMVGVELVRDGVISTDYFHVVYEIIGIFYDDSNNKWGMS